MTKNSSLLLLTKITIIALIVGAISLPNILEIVSPFWMLIFFIYWVIYTDTKAIYLFALILGLLTDILQGSILGQNALALLISSAFIFKCQKIILCFKLNHSTGLCFYRLAHLLNRSNIDSYSNSGFRFQLADNTFAFHGFNYLACCSSIPSKT